MPDQTLRIALLGGIPAALGGGGLEVQVARTREALRGLGHDAFSVWQEPSRGFDVLHAFGTDPDIWHVLQHWRRHAAPLVVSPVVVVAPGTAERRLKAVSRLPVPAFGPRMRVAVLRRAQALVALTEHERDLLRALGGPRTPPITVIGNGVATVPPTPPDLEMASGYVLLLGAVSARKRQAETLRALRGVAPAVVAGRFDGDARARAEWDRDVAASGAQWLGEVHEPGVVAALLRDARALVHLSGAEGQSLAVLEALAHGTPVVLSDLPSHRELAAAWPDFVRLVPGPQGVAEALADLPASPSGAPPTVPTWEQVARQLVDVYRTALAA